MAKSDKPGVFISYSQHDEPMMRKLVAHLKMLDADLWHDRKLVAGDRWAEILDDRLNTAEIILLLISDHFFASDFCNNIELPRALERAPKDETTITPIIIPVIISEYDWEHSPVSPFQIQPSNRKAIESWGNQDEALKDVAKGIRQAVEKLRPQPQSVEPSPRIYSPKGKLSLAYLCDRSDQEERLRGKLESHLKTQATRPVVCLVHGDVREAHKEFMDRLQEWLPGVLKTGSGVKRHVLDVPSDNSTQAFWGKIGKWMDGYPVTKEDVWPHIAHHAEPLMFVLNLRMREAAARCESVINSLLKFCDTDWDDLPAGRFVIFFVCVKYEQMGWAEFKKKSLQSDLQKMLTRLAKDESQEDDGIRLSSYTRVTGVVLPELGSIRETHVDEWSQQYYHLPDHKIRDLFKQGSMPMESFAEELEKLMNDSSK